ncbi:unnamed protein product [Closterium sp. NIES-64]|nr:unnamed protein product [Closterium sp. NIES-64]
MAFQSIKHQSHHISFPSLLSPCAGIVTDGATRDYFQELLFSRPNINHDAIPLPPFSPLLSLCTPREGRHQATLLPPRFSRPCCASEANCAHSFPLSPPAGIVMGGTTRHYFHRFSRAYAMGPRKRGNTFPPFPSAPPSPPAGIVTDSTTPHGITSTAHLEPMSWGCASETSIVASQLKSPQRIPFSTFSPLAGIVTDGTTRHYFHRPTHNLGHRAAQEGQTALRVDSNHQSFRSVLSPPAGIVTDGTTRHYFHRPSRAYAMGLRKRRKVFSDRPSAATLPPGTVGGGGCGWRTGGCAGYRWHKTGKTRPVFARNRKQVRDSPSPPTFSSVSVSSGPALSPWCLLVGEGGEKRGGKADVDAGREESGHKAGKTRRLFAHQLEEDPVLYEMQAQRGKRVFSRLIALTLLASPPPGPTPPLIGWKKILVLYETRAQRGKKRGADERSSPAGGSGKDRKTNWIMHQYHVGEQGEEKEGEWVVSKVFYQIQQRQSSGTRAGSREGSLPPLGQGADEEECGAEGREDIEAVGEGEGGGAEEEEGEEEEVVDDIEDVNDEDGDGDGGMAGAPRAAVAGRGGGLVSGAGGAFVAAGGSVVTAGGSAGAAGGSAVTAGRRGRGGRGGRGVSQGGRGGSRGGRPAKGGVLATRGTFQASQPSPTSAAAASFGAAFLPPGHHPPPLLPAASPVSTAAGAASGAISGAFSGADLITTAEVAPAGAAGALAGPARLLSFHNQAPPCGVQEGALLGTAGPPNTGVPGIGTAMPVPITPPSAHSASGLVALKPPGWGGEAGRLVPCQLQQQQQEQQQQQQQQQGNHAATITPRTEAATAAELVGSAGVSDLRAYEQSLGDSASDIGSYPHSQEASIQAAPLAMRPAAAASLPATALRQYLAQKQQQQQGGGYQQTNETGDYPQQQPQQQQYLHQQQPPLLQQPQQQAQQPQEAGKYRENSMLTEAGEREIGAHLGEVDAGQVHGNGLGQVHGNGLGQVHGNGLGQVHEMGVHVMGSQDDNGAAGKWETGSEAMTLQEATQRHRGTPDDYPFRFLSTPTDEHTDGSPKKTEIGAVAEETVAGATVAGGDVAGGNVAASVTSADAATADAAAVAAPATPRVPSSADVAASAASSGNMEAGCAEGGTPGVGCTGRTTHTSAGSSDGDGRVGGVEGTGGGKSLWKPAARRFSPPAGARGDARGGAATIAGVTITAAAVSDALKDSLKEPWSIPTSQDLPLPSTPIFLSQELPPIEHLPSSLPSLPPSQEPVMCFDATQPVDLGEKEGEEGIGGLGQMREIGAMGGTGENGREQSGGESEEAIQETQVEAEEVGGRRGHVEQEEQQGELEQRGAATESAAPNGGGQCGKDSNSGGGEGKENNKGGGDRAGDKSRAGTATVLGGEANMEGVREGLCGPGGGEVTGAGEGAAVGSCGVATGAVGGCGAMPGAVGSGMLGAAFWIGSSGPGMSNGTWGEWMGPARSGETEIVVGLGSDGHAGGGSECQGREQGHVKGEGNGAVEEDTSGMGGLKRELEPRAERRGLPAERQCEWLEQGKGGRDGKWKEGEAGRDEWR